MEEFDTVEALERAENTEGLVTAYVSRSKIRDICLVVIEDLPDETTVGDLRKMLKNANV